MISAGQITAKELKIMKKTVSYSLETLPPITDEQRARLQALAARPDSEIDLSEMPEWTDEQWKNALRGGFYAP